jgi:hypothetical protein
MGKRIKVLEGKPGWALPPIGVLPKVEFPPLPDIYVEMPNDDITLKFEGVDIIGGFPPSIVIRIGREEKKE